MVIIPFGVAAALAAAYLFVYLMIVAPIYLIGTSQESENWPIICLVVAAIWIPLWLLVFSLFRH